jgi:hypothetical protein
MKGKFCLVELVETVFWKTNPRKKNIAALTCNDSFFKINLCRRKKTKNKIGTRKVSTNKRREINRKIEDDATTRPAFPSRTRN